MQYFIPPKEFLLRFSYSPDTHNVWSLLYPDRIPAWIADNSVEVHEQPSRVESGKRSVVHSAETTRYDVLCRTSRWASDSMNVLTMLSWHVLILAPPPSPCSWNLLHESPSISSGFSVLIHSWHLWFPDVIRLNSTCSGRPLERVHSRALQSWSVAPRT